MKTKHTAAALYLSYVNEFLTVDGFAEHYGMTRAQALHAIRYGKAAHNRKAKAPAVPALPPLRDGITYFVNEHGEKVCTGSQMGRRDTLPDTRGGRALPCKLRLVRLAWHGGDYDAGGAYWGATRAPGKGRKLGAPLSFIFRAAGDVGDERAEIFTRATSRREARAAVLAKLPAARFYR